jgi:hypothetical protein
LTASQGSRAARVCTDCYLKYGVLDQFAEADLYLKKANFDFDTSVNVLLERKWRKKNDWITDYDVSNFP